MKWSEVTKRNPSNSEMSMDIYRGQAYCQEDFVEEFVGSIELEVQSPV